MSVPVSQLTVEQAHKELNSLVEKIAPKYEQLDFDKFEAVGTPTSLLNSSIEEYLFRSELVQADSLG